MSIPKAYLVSLHADRPSLEVIGMNADQSVPRTQGGRGGWVATSRVQRPAFVEWSGVDVETYELKLLLMPDVTGDVDDALTRLDRMSQPPAPLTAPPVVRVGGHVPPTGRRWVITDYTTDDVSRTADGSVTRCVATIQLMLAEDIGSATVARRAPSTHRVKGHESMLSIAVKVYGSAKYAKELARAQTPAVKDIHAKLKVGRVVKLP